MDLDVSMRVTECPFTVHFYGALFREVSYMVLYSERLVIWCFIQRGYSYMVLYSERLVIKVSFVVLLFLN
jgi:hypothetical protein